MARPGAVLASLARPATGTAALLGTPTHTDAERISMTSAETRYAVDPETAKSFDTAKLR